MATIEKTSHREKMFALVEQWEQSKQTKILFCEQQGIVKSSFYYWLKKYHREQSVSSGFVPVLVRRSFSELNQAIEVHYPSGVSVRVPAGSSVTLLKTLIDLI